MKIDHFFFIRSAEGVKKLFNSLFDGNQHLRWSVFCPAASDKAVSASTGKTFDNCATPADYLHVLPAIQKALNAIFDKVIVNESGMMKFWQNVNFQVESIITPVALKDESETRIIHQLIFPILHNITHNSPYTVKGRSEHSKYSSVLSVEQPTESKEDIPGPKPSVDFLIRGETDDANMYLIPVEAKKVMKVKHAKQLADYMSRLAFHEENQSQSFLGIVMDHSGFKIEFSVFMDENGDPQPVVLCSPAITMVCGYLVEPEALCALSLLHLFEMKRIALKEDKVSQFKQFVADAKSSKAHLLESRVAPSLVGELVTKVAMLEKENTGLKQVWLQPAIHG